MNYARHEKFCIFKDVYKIIQSEGFVEVFEVLSELKNKKSEIKSEIKDEIKNTNENSDFGQYYCSVTARSNYKIGYQSLPLTNWMGYYDKFY